MPEDTEDVIAAMVQVSVDGNEGAKLERLIASLGQFGRYQWYVCLLSSIGSFLSAIGVVAMTFLAYEPSHRCQISQCEPDWPLAEYNATFLNFTTPFDKDDNRWERCSNYKFEKDNRGNIEQYYGSSCIKDNFDERETVGCQAGHVYDDSLFRSSIITDFDLWCTAPFYRSLAGIIYMAGMLLGAITLGDLADRIGRKKALVVASTILGVCGIISAVAPNYPVFLAARFVTGAGAVGLFQITFVLAVEFIGTKYRTFVGIMIETPFALGEALTGVLAYFIRDWRYLQLAITVPVLLLISYIWLMPESIRWLVSQNRTEEAIAIIRKVAKTNKKELCEESLDFIRNRSAPPAAVASDAKYTNTADLVSSVEVDSSSPLNGATKKKTLFDLLRNPKMRSRSFNLFFCWGVVTFMYYGLSLNSTNIGSNIFISFILTMLIEIPSYLFSWWALDVLGRKLTLMLMFFLGGIPCIIAGVLDQSYGNTIMMLSLVGKFGASAGFAIVYVYASEIFPTDYRGVGVGACSMFARVGGMLAPLIVEMFRSVPAVSPVIFGVLGCTAGCLVVLLPETVGCILPQTLEESEEFGSDQNTFDCCFCLTQRRRRLQVKSAIA